MARPSISFNRQKGGLGRPLPNNDHYSGLIAYAASLPTGYGSDKIKEVNSIEEVEALGVTAEDSVFKFAHYHASEFFRMQPKGKLWLMFEPIPGTPATRDYAEIKELQEFTEGKIRQIGIFDDVAAFDSADVTKIQTAITTLQGQNMPLSVVFSSDYTGVTDLSTLADLRALNAPNVSVTLAESGSGNAPALRTALGKTLGSVGNTLGAVAFAKVNESIGYVEKFPISDGIEYVSALIGNDSAGTNIKDIGAATLDSLNDKGYIIPRKFVDNPNTYYADSPTSVTVSDDFAYIENNRTIDKAIRGIRTRVQPKLNAPLILEADGTLNESTTTVFKDLTEKTLEEMENNEEISAFEVVINPEQNVLSTSTIEIQVNIVPTGTARQIVINIGFKPSIA